MDPVGGDRMEGVGNGVLEAGTGVCPSSSVTLGELPKSLKPQSSLNCPCSQASAGHGQPCRMKETQLAPYECYW